MTRAPALFDLSGRTALVTGAGGHLGQVVAAGLAEAGARVLLNGRRAEPLEALRDRLRADGLAAGIACFDVTDAAAAARALAGYDRLDVLVNNAYAGGAGTLEEATDAQFAASYETAVTAAFRLVRTALPALRAAAEARGHAAVVNIASMYGRVSPDPRLYRETPPNPPFYGAAKAGLIQLTRHLACALAPERIRVNAVSPGPFPNPATVAAAPDFARRLAERVPLGRIGAPDELKGAVLFLASDAASFVTGIDLPVDGGWTAW